MRRLVPLIASFLLGLMMISPAMAQDASPTPAPLFLSPSSLGVSTFDMSVNADGYDAPETIPAGQYLINVTNTTDTDAEAGFMRPPAGWAAADVQSALDAMATPDAGPETLSWLLDVTFAGGAIAPAGGVGQAVVALTPGTWLIWPGDPSISFPMKEVTVTGTMPALKELPATLTITAVGTSAGYDFAVEGDPVAGPQLIKWVNKSDQPHFVTAFSSPVQLSDEQIMELAMMPEDATPAPDSGLPSMDQLQFNASGLALISAGQVMYGVMEFPSGYSYLECWVPDLRGDGVTPHAMEGMLEEIQVP